MNNKLSIIAGPCSISEENIDEIYEIAETGKVSGTRIVGLKSRSEFKKNTEYMGIDFETVMRNLENTNLPHKEYDFIDLPSTKIAQKVAKDTGLLIASEIVVPDIQLKGLEAELNGNKVMLWNPSVNQLGWFMYQLAETAAKNNWAVGIKNGKWIGEHTGIADKPDYDKETSLEKTWAGLVTYADSAKDVVLIHRGLDVPEKGNYRNIPVHNIAYRVKMKTNAKLYFDPSHAYGPKMKSDILPETIAAMKLRYDETSYLYDGILIEVGTSPTDTQQHISMDELKLLIEELEKFRSLGKPGDL